MHWDISVAGHIPKEDYPNEDPTRFEEARICAAKRELFEELGIRCELEFFIEKQPVNGYHNEYISFLYADMKEIFICKSQKFLELISLLLKT